MAEKRKSKYTAIGQRIAALAKNQTEIANAIGTSQQNVSFKLTGKVDISIDELRKISDHYNIPLLYFIEPYASLCHTPEDARKFHQMLHIIHDDRANLMKVVDGLIDRFGKQDQAPTT